MSFDEERRGAHEECAHEIEKLRSEVERQKTYVSAYEEREASCCPEGTRFEAVIAEFRAEVAHVRESHKDLFDEVIAAQETIAGLLAACDDIVAMTTTGAAKPDRLSTIEYCYARAKGAAAKARGEG